MVLKKSEPTALQTTKEIINGIWSISRDIYKGTKEEINNTIEEETHLRVRAELNLEFNQDIDLNDSKVKKLYEYHKKQVKKEAKELGLKGGLIIFGLGWLF